MTKRFMVAMAFLITIPALAQGSYSLRFGNLPSRGIPCVQAAAQITDAFKKETGVLLARAQCTQETGDAYDIVLYYTADLEVDPMSTVEYYHGAPAAQQGIYDTAAQCEAALPAQTALFRAQTTLEPIVAYCYREADPSRRPYALRIDAFGKARSALFLSTRTLYGAPIGNVDLIEARFAAHARAKLTNFVSLSLRQLYTDDYTLRTSYYGDDLATVEAVEIGQFHAGGSCERARALAESALASIPNAPPMVCLYDKWLVRDSLEMYQVKLKGYLDAVSYPRAYANVADCEADETAAMRDVAASLGVPSVGAVCIGDSAAAGMKVFVQRAQ